MIEQDTIRLLRECDAGIKMGVSSLEQVMDYAKSEKLRNILTKSKIDHEKVKEEIQAMLDNFHDDGKNPNPLIQKMSQVKTSMGLMVNDADYKIADIMTDGCNMGVKSLSKYLNEYKAASEESKYITRKVIKIEEKLSRDLREFL